MALASLALERCFKGFDMNSGELAQRHCPDVGNDVVLNNSAMPNGSLPCDAALNINREPMFEVFRDAHLCRINISPFIPTIEQPI
jgi:hypothetical protein